MHFQGISCSRLWLLWSGLHIPAKEKKLQVKCHCDGGGVMCQTSSDVKACQKNRMEPLSMLFIGPVENRVQSIQTCDWDTKILSCRQCTWGHGWAFYTSLNPLFHLSMFWILFVTQNPVYFHTFFSRKLGLCFLTGIFRCAWPKYMKRRW